MSEQSKIIVRAKRIFYRIFILRDYNSINFEPDLLRLVAAIKQWCIDNADEKTVKEIFEIKWNNPIIMCFLNIQFYYNDLPDIVEIKGKNLPHASVEYAKFGKTIIWNGTIISQDNDIGIHFKI